jgi:hypothetical protein
MNQNLANKKMYIKIINKYIIYYLLFISNFKLSFSFYEDEDIGVVIDIDDGEEEYGVVVDE